MNYGGINFEHVWAFQLKCMMVNQYSTLVEAVANQDADQVIVACLRLGWNDAFRHVSENVNGINNAKKEELIIQVCTSILGDFKEYAQKATTQDRKQYIDNLFANRVFANKFNSVKIIDVTISDKALCFGHIQKMFNMAIKLLLCLIISAEQAEHCGINVKLGVCKGKDVYLNGGFISYSTFPYAYDTADCPLDSKILEKIGWSDAKWSKFGSNSNYPTKDYEDAQQKIEDIQKETGKCNLCFDFENWN